MATQVTPSLINLGAQYGIVTTSQTTTSTTYTDLATVGPSVTVTIGANGMALVMMNADVLNNTGASYSVIGLDISGATTRAAAAPYEGFYQAFAANAENKISYGVLVTGLTPGSTTFKLKYRIITASTGTFSNREISVIPL